jgi:hypothetical protein
MEETIAEKDVGVTIDNKLFFDKHITEKVNKANSRLFHILTTRLQNEFFLMLSLHHGLNNLYL